MKKLTHILAEILMLTLLVGILAGCSNSQTTDVNTTSDAKTNSESGSSSSDDVIKIGYIDNLTGDSSAYGILCQMGVNLAHELNDTVLGKKIELITVDNKSDKVESANAASRLIEQEKVVAILAPTSSGLSMAIGEIIKEAKIPTMASSATNPLVTQDNPYFWRICFTNDFKAKAMAQFAFDQGWKKVALMTEITNESAVNSVGTFKNALQELTGDADCCPVEVSYSSSDTDFSAQLGVLAQYEFDAIYCPGNYSYVPLIVGQAMTLGQDYQWLGTDSWDVGEFITLGGDNVVNRCYFPTFFDANGAKLTDVTTTLLEEFAKKYGSDETVAPNVALGFDAYNVLVKAIETAGSSGSLDGDSICKALKEMKDVPCATGYITFNDEHNVENLCVIKTVGEDKTFTYVTTVYPSTK